MKTLTIIICALGLTLGAAAQKVVRVAPHYYARPRVSVGVGVYSPYYHPYYWYNPFYAYPPAYGYRPTRLDLEIQDIQNDYKDRIWSARHDESLSRKERRQKIQELKHERDAAIIQAKKDYYKRY